MLAGWRLVSSCCLFYCARTLSQPANRSVSGWQSHSEQTDKTTAAISDAIGYGIWPPCHGVKCERHGIGNRFTCAQKPYDIICVLTTFDTMPYEGWFFQHCHRRWAPRFVGQCCGSQRMTKHTEWADYLPQRVRRCRHWPPLRQTTGSISCPAACWRHCACCLCTGTEKNNNENAINT